MGWRKIQKEDVRRGLCLRLQGMNDTVFNGAVILAFNEKEDTVLIARPYLFAHQHFDSTGGLMGCETYENSLDNLLRSEAQVYEYWSHHDQKNQVRISVT